MHARVREYRFVRVASLVGALLTLPGAAWAARDRSAPTAPGNLRVTAVTAYTVTLAWNRSTDNSGSIASYVICCANVSSQTAPGNVTSVVYTNGLEAGRSFTLRMYAVDAAGNYSKPSNSVTFTLLRDTSPPSQPVLSVTGVGATHVSLLWSSTDDSPNLWYTLFRDGSPVITGTRQTSTILTLLRPETTYTFTVGVQDFGGNRAPASQPATATTNAVNANDVTPPSTPANFRADNWGDCEVQLDWDESTDDLDPQWLIEYQVFVNGVYDHSLSLRYHRTIVYGNQNGVNTFGVVAVDTAGNRSELAETTDDLNCHLP
jgi:chitinase